MPLAWTNDSTWTTASRRIWRETVPGDDRSATALERFSEFVRELVTAEKIVGNLVGIGLDDVDFIQVADYTLGGIAAYHEPARV
jgi:hypothetical protein